MFRQLRIADQLVDRLGREELFRQVCGSCYRIVRRCLKGRWCSRSEVRAVSCAGR
ncbi:hypothetical protein ACPOL_2399 [Acidisarcina polymorpha]|uniref:Uncharacterized protein n=1 Tax=Acidisarcina polymorpha TaxID=2211140 RepID=A0A2Z5FXY3_9BACT|nr:hypothetical protein ACPOL_2399 [Acidisarcina polymorpha]